MLFQDKAASDVVIVVNSVLAFTSIISVGIRFYRPGSSRGKFDAQDIMLFMAAFCGTVMSILQCVGTSYGLGSHFMALQPSHIASFLKLYPAIMAFYFACNMFVKFALLIFYLRTTYERSHLWAIWAMIFAAFAFGISNVFVVVFQCTPLDKLWNPTKPGHCIDILPFYYANAWIMIVNDTIMYIMPIVFTWKLALRRPQRIVLNLLFALGAVVVVTSVLRLLALIRFDKTGKTDFTYHIASILLWSAVENHTAIFITCTPSIKALVVGTLVPFVTSVQSSVSEKVKTLRGSQVASSPRSGLESQDQNPFNMQIHMARKVRAHPSSRRQSLDSNNSHYDLTAARVGSAGSCGGSLSRNDSESSIEKGTCVAVIPLQDLEAQTLPPYTYVPNQWREDEARRRE